VSALPRLSRAFHRAHQAWYTANATDAADWGIAAFSGRSAAAADAIAPQDGVFTLVERGPGEDRIGPIGSIVEAHSSTDGARRAALLANPGTALVTLTVTEAGYTLRPDGRLDLLDPTVASDIALLRRAAGGGGRTHAAPASVIGMLVAGLEARRLARGGPIAVVPCDNFPRNGALLQDAVTEFGVLVSAGLRGWIADNVSFVSTSVDRITPRVDTDLAPQVADAMGWVDAAPVVTEPFADWTLSGEFPSGRPLWDSAGALFVDDIEAYESRKLWLLNGAHSLLAYLGRLRGHASVAAAMGDPVCRRAVDAWWDEAARNLPADIPVDAYRRALVARFENPRIVHLLAQISADGLTKIVLRIVPVALRERRQGRAASASAAVVGAWIAALRAGLPMPDSRRDDVEAALDAADPTGALLTAASAELAADPGFRAEVEGVVRTLLERAAA
jgi:fructuronate reductase